MPKVEFEYDINKDKRNILRVINNPPMFEPDNLGRPLGKLSLELVDAVRIEKDATKQDKMVQEFLDLRLANEKNLIDKKVEIFAKEWDKINDEYFDRLENILGVKMGAGVIYKAYLTSAGSCPFNAGQRYFMIRLDDDRIDVVAAHEILHIEFIRNFGLYCRDTLKLKQEEFMEFQEASTFLLNEEMGSFLSRPDYGYKEHQELRLKLATKWKANKKFIDLLVYYKNLKEIA